jgi:ribose transport system permease protein
MAQSQAVQPGKTPPRAVNGRTSIGHSVRRLIVRHQNVLIIWGVLLVALVVSSFVAESFTNPRNFPNIMRQAAGLMLVSIGQLIIMLTGGIDLSVGSLISLVIVAMAAIMQPTPESMLLASGVGLSIGLLAGLINGVLVTRFRLAPFMVTLAGLSFYQGVALQLRQNPQATLPREYSPFFTGELIEGLPIPFVIIIVATFIAWIVLKHTRIGRHIYAVGSNEHATRLSGMATDRVKVIAYTLGGFMAACAGLYVAARSRAGDPYIGESFAFDSITAVVLGGAALSGGSGSVWGTMAGVFIITILSNVLNLAGVPSNYQYILKGGLLVLAVMLYRRRH